jgi:hypothetical protein
LFAGVVDSVGRIPAFCAYELKDGKIWGVPFTYKEKENKNAKDALFPEKRPKIRKTHEQGMWKGFAWTDDRR